MTGAEHTTSGSNDEAALLFWQFKTTKIAYTHLDNKTANNDMWLSDAMRSFQTCSFKV